MKSSEGCLLCVNIKCMVKHNLLPVLYFYVYIEAFLLEWNLKLIMK